MSPISPLRLASSNAWSLLGDVSFGGKFVLDLRGVFNLGGGSSARQITVSDASTVTVASLANGLGTSSLIKNGTGTLILSDASYYSGQTTVLQGRLLVNGSVASTQQITIASGGTLGGSGTIAGSASVGGVIDAGAAGGTSRVGSGGLQLAGGTLAAQINGPVISDSFDQINVAGAVNLSGASLSLSGARRASGGQQITLIRNDGSDAIVGAFNGIAEGATLSVNGVAYTISYIGGTGNDVVLTDTTAGSLFDGSPFGVSINHTRSMNVSSWMPQTAVTGVKWVRGLPASWPQVENTQGTFNFGSADNSALVASQLGFNMIGGLAGAPGWTGSNGNFPVNNLPAWRNYVTAAVGRYRNQVKHWEVWNEPPNFTNNLGTAQQYGTLVASAYDAAKAVDPTTLVGIAGSSVNISFIKHAILNGARNKFDFLTLHPYEMLGQLDSGYEAAYMSIVGSVRKMLRDVNPEKADVPIIFTEIGTDVAGSVTADKQASQLVKAFTMDIAQGVQQTDWFEARDGDSGRLACSMPQAISGRHIRR